MITRQEAKQIVDYVVQEIRRRQFPYVTDGKVDLSKTTVGIVTGGTSTSGGQIDEGAIYDRHVNNNADIRGTKVRAASILERGVVELAEHYEAMPGLALQSDDPRLHETVPSGSIEHDIRYYTKENLGSTEDGFGASLVGVEDPSGYFLGTNVEAVLSELFLLGIKTFIDLLDTPSDYSNRFTQVPTVTEDEVGLEWRPTDYYDGGNIAEDYSGAVVVKRGKEVVDAESATMNNILDGGLATDIDEIEHINGLGGEVTINGAGTNEITVDGQIIVISGQDSPSRPYWEDLRTPVNMLKFSSTKPPVWTAYKGGHVAAFEDQAVNYQSVYWTWQMPHSYELGTPVTPHIHIVPEDNAAGNVHWEFTYSIAKKNAEFPPESVIHITQVMPEVTDYHTYFELTTISGSEFPSNVEDISTIMLCGLHRRSDELDDTYEGKSVYLLEVDLHYLKDTWGSRLSLTK